MVRLHNTIVRIISFSIFPCDLSINFSWQKIEFKIPHISGSHKLGVKDGFHKNISTSTVY